MTIAKALSGVRRLFLDTAPVIYYVEGRAAYRSLTAYVFDRISEGAVLAVTSSITLAESLVHPLRADDEALAQRFRNVIVAGRNTLYVGVDPVVESAAAMRARYGLTLADALQVAAAVAAGCNAFLTNDRELKRVREIQILVLDELEL